MTFVQIVTKVMDRLNLTSQDAQDRIGENVNDRYKRVTTSIGLQTSRREVIDVEQDPVTDTDLPEIEIEGIEKVEKIWYLVGVSPRILDNLSYSEITSIPTKRAMPKAFAVKRMGSGRVIITLDAYPEEEFTLKVEGYDIAEVLEDDIEPYLPSDFHDILLAGVMSDELMKMEKPQLAELQEQKFERRLSDLRMFIAKSGYQDIMQNKLRSRSNWINQWFSRIGIYS